LSPNTFYNNTAEMEAGDIVAFEYANVVIAGAIVSDSAAGAAGALLADGNATTLVRSSSISGGVANENAGCVAAIQGATLHIIRTLISGCRSGHDGGAVLARDSSILVLTSSTLVNNTAGTRDSGAYGGGLFAYGSASIQLDAAVFKENTASYGGGLVLQQDASLSVRRPSVFANNTAGIIGGGVRLYSDRFDLEEVATKLLFAGNNASTAGLLPVSYAPRKVQVVDNGNADNFITSDSKDGVLTMTLNVSGPQGLPCNDGINYVVDDSAGTVLFGYRMTPRSALPGNFPLKYVSIAFKRPAGKLGCSGLDPF
jgi:hypothetical protein